MNKELEKNIQSAICDYLAFKKVFFWRSNNIPAFEQKSGFYRPMPKYSMRGVPDIIIIKKGQFIGLEVKRPKGKQSDNQIEFQKNCELNGGKYYVVFSIDDVIKLGL